MIFVTSKVFQIKTAFEADSDNSHCSLFLHNRPNGIRRDWRKTQAEMMTILVMYHESGYKNLKSFYLREIALKYRKEFPHLVSYNRFVELQNRCVMPLFSIWFVNVAIAPTFHSLMRPR
jgi:hypothetical protein